MNYYIPADTIAESRGGASRQSARFWEPNAERGGSASEYIRASPQIAAIPHQEDGPLFAFSRMINGPGESEMSQHRSLCTKTVLRDCWSKGKD
jgi:hypothetical protein